MVCACVCEFVCMHAYACIWRPEVDTGCLPQFFSTLFLRQGLTLNFELIYTRQVDQQAPGIFPYPPVTSVGVTNTHLQALLLCGCWRSKLGSSHLYSKPPPASEPSSQPPNSTNLDQLFTQQYKTNIQVSCLHA